MEAGTTPPPEEAGLGYTGAPVVGAVLATVCFPFISLLVALLLQGGEQDPRKKSQLRTWAWASAGWMVLWLVIVVVAAGSIGSGSSGVSRSGPCQGGPDSGSTGKNIPGTNKYVFPCVFGGTETTRLPTP